MANNKEHQVKEAFEAIRLSDDIAARTLASIEAKRKQQESERTAGLLAAQEGIHANKHAGQKDKATEESSDSPASRHEIEASKGSGSATPQKRRKALHFTKGGRIAAIAACLALVACLIGGAVDFLRPVAYVGIDVNPSVELTLNRFDIVVGTHALNDDGQRTLDEASCMWRVFDDAARDLDGAMRSIADEGAVVEVSIECDNENRYAALAAQSNDCFGRNGEAHCNRTSAEERQAAHDSGMGVAKYRAYKALQEAGVDITAEECASMSMRDLRDLLAGNGIDEKENNDEHAGMGNEQGGGAHNGNGAGSHGGGSNNGNGKHAQNHLRHHFDQAFQAAFLELSL
ncbi:hypothetical protein [uncultured Slackia sp.]|uniref:anti-sigma-I factor RsgI family protein n=1 Tax=uncultured Slackia sp. TaxID=665903 RepID=UPI0026DB1C13|nr:hypothetical protein [uncultured Slackia sp.]